MLLISGVADRTPYIRRVYIPSGGIITTLIKLSLIEASLRMLIIMPEF